MDNSVYTQSMLDAINALFPDDESTNNSNSSSSGGSSGRSGGRSGGKSGAGGAGGAGKQSSGKPDSADKSGTNSSQQLDDSFGEQTSDANGADGASGINSDNGWGDALTEADIDAIKRALGITPDKDGVMDGSKLNSSELDTAAIVDAISQAMSDIDNYDPIDPDGTYFGPAGSRQQNIADTYTAPAINWVEYLTTCVSSHSKTERSWSRLNRRSHSLGYPMASERKVDSFGDMLFCIDVSGSMWSVVKHIVNEIVSLSREYPLYNSRIIYYDNLIQADELIDDFSELPSMSEVFNIKGGGGNDIGCVAKYIEEMEYTPVTTFFFTDGGDNGTPIFNDCEHTYIFITKDGITDILERTKNKQPGSGNITIVKTTLAGR